jgi:4-amino-4-deoxy-L-arabinose transferase-like glycosyltransferase
MRRLNTIYGVILGLATARFLLEIPDLPVPVPLILAAALVGGTAGFLLSHRLPLMPGWSALPLLALVLWPRRLSPLEWATIGCLVWISASLWESDRPPLFSDRQADRLADVGVCILFFAVYLVSLSQDVLPADSGEFQLVAALLGVAHPPGYPLYTMAGHLFIQLVPIGTPALRLNLMSVPMAVVTLLWLARATRLWARHLGASPRLARRGGLAAALTLGSTTTFWAQATIANIRMPTLFFGALALYALARFAVDGTLGNGRLGNGQLGTGTLGTGGQERALLLLALALGLGIGHHPSLAFVGIFFVLYVLVLDPRLVLQPRRWWCPVLVFLAALLMPLAYLPIRGATGAPLAPSDLDTLQGFLWHVLAQGFAGDMFAFANPQDFPHRLALLPTLLTFQFNGLLLALALLGLLTVLRRNWQLFLLLAGSFLLHTYVTLTYRAPQTVEYLMPAYLPVALAVGLLPIGLGNHEDTKTQRNFTFSSCLRAFVVKTHPLLTALALWAGFLNLLAHRSIAELATDTSTRQTVQPLLEAAPSGAVILADWHWATPLWYLQQVEGRRPDVAVEYVYPVAGEDYGATWLRRVEEFSADRPLLLTHFYDFPGYSAEPVGAGFRLHQRPAVEATAPLSPTDITFAEGVQLVGYRLPTPPFRAGQPLEITLAWRRTVPSDRAPSFTLRLTDADGREFAQADRYLGADVVPGEVRWERLVLPLYPTLPPGRYRLTLGAYTVSGAGFEPLLAPHGESFILLTEVDVEPSVRLPFTLHPQHVPYAGGPTLVGADYDRTVPDTLRVYLRWRGPTEGETLRLRAPGGAEGTARLPALPQGAYQTVAVDLPGTARGSLSLSLTDSAGAVRTAAGPWGWPLRGVPLVVPPGDVRFVPLGDEVAVVGIRASPADPGAVMTVDVALVGLRALTTDDATSVRLTDEAGRFLGAHDCQPALGTVPTLKWIAGSRVRDRHLIPIPADWAGDGIRATLVAYERFRLIPLPPMDDRRWEAVPLR